MKTASTYLLSVTVLLVHLACSEERRGSAGGTWVAEHDTIGDTVIVRTISGSVGFAEYTLQRELSIGVLDGPEEYVIGNVSMLAVGPEGDIYAYDAQVPVLRKYDRDGRFITTIGREGGGPGEYGRVRGLLVVPDGTVKLWDARGPRLISFSPEGEYLGGRRVESYGFFGSRSLFADTLGNYYVRMRFVEATEDGERTVGRGLLKLGPNGEVVDTLLEPDARYEPPRLEGRFRTGNITYVSRRTIPFMPEPSWTFSPHGHFVAGEGDRYAVSLLRTDGPVLRIERQVDPVPVDATEKAAWRESITSSMRRGNPRWRWDGPDIPDTKPAFRELKVGLDGRIWVWLYQKAEKQEVEAPGDGPANPRQVWPEPTVFDVFEPDGRYVGAVRVPGETTIHVMKGDHVWGVTRDSLDVQYIERFRLVGVGSGESGVGSGEFD
ncbi:MAG: hypothetical protein IIB35_08615 [Gemmatimonadetes bacterium]|nr:hypothetical protein [Gemmatimonadota bacterium]